MVYRPRKAYLLLLPGLCIVAFMALYPLARAILLSFSTYHLLHPEQGSRFAGMANFVRVVSDPQFGRIMTNTLVYVSACVVGSYFVGLSTALLLNAKFIGRKVARSLVIIVWAVPSVVTCIIWMYMYNPQWGVISYFLMKLGLIQEPLRWLADMNAAMWGVVIASIWKTFPFATVSLLGGLQTIPEELFEAARMDGTSPLQLFRYVTLPHLGTITNIVILLFTIWTIRNFEYIYIMTEGGPGKATTTIVIQTYRQAFQSFDFAGAAAIGVISLVISLILSIIYSRLAKIG
jgi:multiple sugar transport system permease protein